MWIEKFQVEKTNKIAALDPVTKIWLVLLYSTGAIILSTISIAGIPMLLIPYLAIIFIVASLSGSFKAFSSAVGKIMIFAGIILLFQSFLMPGGETLFSLGFLKVSEDGLETGTRLALSILCIASSFLWLFTTTENKEISRALEKSGMNYKACYVFLSTMQMVELLGRNSKTIMNAQQARGVETQGSMMARAKAFMPSLIPLILGAIIGSEDRALALESKGFDVQCKKTHLLDVNKSGNEGLALTLGVLLLIITVGIRGALWGL